MVIGLVRAASCVAALAVLAPLGCGGESRREARREAPRKQVAAEAPVKPPADLASKQPRPGERVRQPLLDGYCDESDIPLAFYYHGGRPVSRVAVRDGCSPLYVPECDEHGTCIARETEQGMWCCEDPVSVEARAAAH